MIEVEIDKDVYLPVYHDILDCDSDIILLWGGRDSGKSHYIAQRLIEKCLSADYFRCILVKKTYESIKDSQFQLLKDIVDDWGLDELFDFKTHPLEVHCKNGNKFIARGCDNAGKIKSISNPSDVWFEEADQISESDYTTVTTTLRSNKSSIQEWLSFNPEDDGVLEDFWIYKNFFKASTALSFTASKDIQLGEEIETITYTSKHVTYKDNPFVSNKRKAKLEGLNDTSPYYYTVYTLGLWGTREVINPFIVSFDKNKHESNEAVFDPNKQLRIVFDFNLNPFCFIFLHIWRDANGEHCHIFDEHEITAGSIPAVADYIKLNYSKQLSSCLITGDSMGNRGDISQRDNATLYVQIMRLLNLRQSQIQVPNNPTHENSRADCNYVLSNFKDIKINPTKCPNLLRDIKSVQCDAFGSIIKKNRKDVTQRADFLDTLRYMVNTWLTDWIKTDIRLTK